MYIRKLRGGTEGAGRVGEDWLHHRSIGTETALKDSIEVDTTRATADVSMTSTIPREILGRYIR